MHEGCFLIFMSGTLRLFTCLQHDTPIHHRARQIKSSDFMTFTHILASDQSNLGRLRDFQPKNSTAQVRLWGSYLDGEPIPDPYYGGIVRRIVDIYGRRKSVDLNLWHARMGLKRFTNSAMPSLLHSSIKLQQKILNLGSASTNTV